MPNFASRSEQGLKLKRRHDRFIAAASACFCVTSQLKLAEIQYLEIIFALDLLVIAVWIARNPSPLHLYRPIVKIGMRWVIFSALALLLSLYSLQSNFYLQHASVLKQPFIVTLARLGELFLDVFFMLYLAEAYRENAELCRFATRAYYFVGLAGALYSLVSAIGLIVKLNLGGAYGLFRMRGFNNEGGSYGTYLLTVIFVTTVMYAQGWLSRRSMLWSLLLFCVCLLGSQSKAALFEVFTFMILMPLLRMRGARLLAMFTATSTLVVILFFALNVPKLLTPYTRAIGQYRTVSLLRPTDGNYVMGRVSGLFLAPKMIKAHPFVGIGLGNYPIVRDDPAYRQGTPIVAPSLDSPSLGPIDYVVDLGFPLFLYFTWTELAPTVTLVRKRASFGLCCLMLMQPVANWFGAHLNLTYPWIAGAIALGVGFGGGKDHEDDEASAGTQELPRPYGLPA